MRNDPIDRAFPLGDRRITAFDIAIDFRDADRTGRRNFC
jgi:hypothetical protein